MKESVRKVQLLKPFNVDEINIRSDRYFPNAYIIDLPLDSTPDHIWQDIFEGKWKSSQHLWDRKLFVMGDKLRLVTTSDGFGNKLDWIERVITDTNKNIDNYNQVVQREEERKMKEEIQKQQSWEQKARIEMIKDSLRKRFA